MKFKAGLIACAALAGFAAPAAAVTITKTYRFEASNVQGRYDRVWGWFNATYDSKGGALKVNSFSSNLPVSYETMSGSTYNNVATIGNMCDEHGCEVTSGQDQFYFVFVIDPEGDVVYPYSLIYSQVGKYELYEGPREDFKVSAAVAGVPEPANWALMIGGFGAIGGAMRRRARMAAAA